MIRKYIIPILSVLLFTGCGVYRHYERPDVETEDLYTEYAPADTTTIADKPWHELFTDPCLQKLVEQALERNTDLRVAYLKTEEAKAVVRNAKLAYLPSVNMNAEGAVSRLDGNTSKTYNLGAGASWEIDLFGKLTAAKREAAAALESSEAYRQAVQTGLVSTVADSYYTLLMLDNQLGINTETQKNWAATIRVLEALKKSGRSNEAAVLQARANLLALENAEISLRKSISETENALSSLLAVSSQSIERGTLDEQSFPDDLSVGVPLQLLSRRPDVRQAEFELARAFYATNVARAAFYPSINLAGTLGWTNNGGGIVLNPAQWLLNAIGSLTQPLFNRGTNIANLKIAKARQEEATLLFRQSLLDAGEEVNNSLTQLQSARKRITNDRRRIDILREAVRKTELLMRHSPDATYLEVLTAQQSLLDAENTLAQDRFDEIQGIIHLYRALGGGGCPRTM